jgi:hypothetical protein
VEEIRGVGEDKRENDDDEKKKKKKDRTRKCDS